MNEALPPAASPMAAQTALRQTQIGVLCGVGAGALWGLVFLAPELVRQFTPLQLAIGRYLAYGLISAALIVPRWNALRKVITLRNWGSLLWLALLGNTLYYILLSMAVQKGGAAQASLVLGMLPVAVTIIGSRDHGAVPLKKLLPSLALYLGGALCIAWEAIAPTAFAPTSGAGLTGADNQSRIFGLVCAFGALVSWTTFAIGNARCLTRLNHVSVHDWNLLTGLVTGAQAIALIPLAVLTYSQTHTSADWFDFIAISLGIAVFASIVGNALWNQMSRLLPLTMVGQMILFETLFALIYAFIWEERLPRWSEVSAFVLIVASVVSCFAAHRKPNSPL